MRRFWTVVCGVLLPAVLVVAAVGAAPASAVGVQQDKVVSDVPSGRTPQIVDIALNKNKGPDDVRYKVYGLAEAGSRIVVVGQFTQVKDAAANGATTFDRPYIFAFDKTTGAVDRAFAPQVNGLVKTVIAGPAGTVYFGGTFSTVNGKTARNLAQVNLSDGSLTAFRAAATNGAVNDLRLDHGRLYVAGFFTTVANVGHGGLATMNPTTGALDPYMGVNVAVNHNYPDRGSVRASVGVTNFDITPDGTHMAAIGNFRIADGLPRDQLMTVLLGSTGVTVDPNWRTTRYEPACFSWAYDNYIRDVQYSPDGSYFAVGATGGHNAGTLCDTATRWETADQGQDVQPTWVTDTGGDTIHTVAITGSAVYVGGHQRWLNNPTGNDYAGAGAVPRPGIGALDPRTGVPLSWNPGRNPRGAGAEALLVTSMGLYVGSDTEYIGNYKYYRSGLA
jgi:hypothetical protein